MTNKQRIEQLEREIKGLTLALRVANPMINENTKNTKGLRVNLDHSDIISDALRDNIIEVSCVAEKNTESIKRADKVTESLHNDTIGLRKMTNQGHSAFKANESRINALEKRVTKAEQALIFSLAVITAISFILCTF